MTRDEQIEEIINATLRKTFSGNLSDFAVAAVNVRWALAALLQPPSDDRVTLDTFAEEGTIRIEQHGAVLARTKSFTVARRIRDALNAPRCLEGQRVKVTIDQVTGDEHGLGGTKKTGERVVYGIVMAMTTLAGQPAFVLRLADNRLETFVVDGAEVIDTGQLP